MSVLDIIIALLLVGLILNLVYREGKIKAYNDAIRLLEEAKKRRHKP